MADEKTSGQGGKKSKTGMILIIAALVLGSGLGFVTAKMFAPKSAAVHEEKKPEIPDSVDGKPNYEKVKIDNLVMNVFYGADKKRKGILAISLDFQIKPIPAGPEVFKEKDSEIRDLLNDYFRSKTIEFLMEPKARPILKKEIKERVNGVLGEEVQVTAVYFPSFIIQ